MSADRGGRLRVDNPLAYAAGVRTIDAAARAAAAIEAEISLATTRPEQWYDDAQDALEQLHSRFPGLHHRDAYRNPPTLSPSARSAIRAPTPARQPTPTPAAAESVPRRRHHRLRDAALLAALLAVLTWLLTRHLGKVIVALAVVIVVVTGHAVLLGFAAAAMLLLAARGVGLPRLAAPRAPRRPRR